MATQADGILVAAGQIFVSSLDAAPREQDIITGVASIDAGEIVADQITTANLILTNKLNASGDLELTGFTNVNRLTATQIGIGTTNPVNDFQVGEDRFIVSRVSPNIVTVLGNVFSTNLIATNLFRTENNKFVVDSGASNTLQITGNTYSTKIIAGPLTETGADAALFQNGNVVISNGDLNITGNIVVAGNVSITDALTYLNAENLIVSNACIQMADGYPGGAYDNALLMTDHPGVEANLVFGYSTSNNEFMFSKTMDSAYTFGGPGEQLINLDSNTVNVHVYGKFYTDSNVGVANIAPTHTLCVGSNVFVDDTGSNVLHATGNVFIQQLSLGDGGISSTNELLQINPSAEPPIVMNANVQMDSFRTTGTSASGVSNGSPTDTLSIGTKVFVNLTAANTLTISGNTVTTNLETQVVASSSNILVHADRTGPDSTSNALVLRSGPTTSNVSSIEVYGASTSNSHQNIRFKTKNTERMRITSNGYIGIANTSPTEALTVSGNVQVTGSNAVVYGNTWGSKGMRMYALPNTGENKIENIVNTGKGLNFFASTTSTMGAAKMTILESSNVGIGTTQPQSLFQTSGGSAFINQQVTRRNSYNHLSTPLVVNNTSEITVVNTTSNVFQLTREGTGSKYGARASFKLGKWDMTDNQSKTRLDINLADDDYAVDTNIMTIRSDGKIGIGHTVPEAFLEVKCSGVGDVGLLVHNHDNGDAIISTKTDLAEGNAFSSYVNGNAGWSVGITGAQGDFRITENATKVSDVNTTAIYINGANSNVGIGTDATRGELEVNGNVVIGNMLTFGGLEASEFGNTAFIERRYGEDQAKNELVIYKGNKGSGLEGTTRIRHIAAEHLFQTYNDAVFDLATNLPLTELNTAVDIPLRITPDGAVIINGKVNTAPSDSANKLVVAGNIEFTAGGQFKLEGIEFETSNPISGDSVNIYRNIADSGTARAMTFVHEISDGDEFEFARFNQQGHLGIGTDTITGSNVQIHNSSTSDSDVLKLTSNAAVSGTTKTGVLLYLDDEDGGYMRGYHDTTNDITGLILGGVRDGTDADAIRITHTSNVGIGTTNPLQKAHLYDGTFLIEHASSNAVIEFKTTGGTSNIISDTTGNVYINPTSTETFINSNLTVENDFTVGGNIDLGNAVAIDLGGDTANTALQVGGGLITNSNQVACKRYAQAFTRSSAQSQDVQLYFSEGSFYAKIVAVLRETGDVSRMSTLVLEIQGGTHDQSVSTVDIAVGTNNLFGGTNDYPWSSTVSTAKQGIIIKPNTGNTSAQNYDYDLFIELVSSRNGKLESIRTNTGSHGNDPDALTTDEITSFTY